MQWDAFTATNESNRELTNRLTRQSCPLGIIVDTEGKRFLDEGADFRTNPRAIAIEKRNVTAADRMKLRMAPGGGFAIRFVRLGR